MTREVQYDVFLSYNNRDRTWVKQLATSIESEQYGSRPLKVFLDELDIVPGKNVIKAIEDGLETARYVCPILSENSIGAEWPNMEWSIAISKDPSGSKGTIIPIWLGGCDIPPSLKIRNVLYCNTELAFKKSYNRLIAILKNKNLRMGERSSTYQDTFYSEQFPIQYEDDVDEQLASNLFPIVTVPKVVWYGPSNYTNKEVYDRQYA